MFRTETMKYDTKVKEQNCGFIFLIKAIYKKKNYNFSLSKNLIWLRAN